MGQSKGVGFAVMSMIPILRVGRVVLRALVEYSLFVAFSPDFLVYWTSQIDCLIGQSIYQTVSKWTRVGVEKAIGDIKEDN